MKFEIRPEEASNAFQLFNKNFCYRAIMQWVQKAGRELESQKETLKEEVKILEMDELYSRSTMKKLRV